MNLFDEFTVFENVAVALAGDARARRSICSRGGLCRFWLGR